MIQLNSQILCAFADGRLFHHPFPGQLRVTAVLPSLCCFLQQIEGDENTVMVHTHAIGALSQGIIAIIKKNNKNLK